MNELDYYYGISKGKSIKEDLTLCTQLCNTNSEDLNIQDYVQNLKPFLKEKGINYLGFPVSYSTFSVNKTVLSDAQEKSEIIYMEVNQQQNSLTIDNELQREYIQYMNMSQVRK